MGKDSNIREIDEKAAEDSPKRPRGEDMGLVVDLRQGGERKAVSIRNCRGNLVTMTTEEEEVELVHRLIKQQEAAGKGYIHCVG